MLSDFKDLGIGVGLRPAHYHDFLYEKPDSVSWVEVISENFMNWKQHKIQQPLQILERIRKDYPVVLHGVSLSIGSCDPINKDYLTSLNELIHKIDPPWISDHLCWTGVQGENLHDLLPLPYTQECLELIVNKLQQVQDFLGRRILIENPSTYLQFAQDEMTEWEFLNLVAKQADCGILLDINNIYVNSINHNFDPLNYLKAMPKNRVCQIHLAGHSNKGTHLIDTHDAPVCKEVWNLYKKAVQLFGNVSVMIERDDNIPPWNELEIEIKKLSTTRREEGGKNSSFAASISP
jgi:uncharacterized protein (UPF0276 family)